MSRGQFIILEGGDGAGKTTFINFLKEKHPEYVFSKEPGGDGKGVCQSIRELVLSDGAKDAEPLTMFGLFWASKAEAMGKIVRPAIGAGQVVISDRFDASTYAFQIGENPSLEPLFWMVRDSCFGNIVPVYLDFEVSVETSKNRLNDRGEKNHYDIRDEKYRARVRTMYSRFFSDQRIKSSKVDANQPKKEMVESAYQTLQEILKL